MRSRIPDAVRVGPFIADRASLLDGDRAGDTTARLTIEAPAFEPRLCAALGAAGDHPSTSTLAALCAFAARWGGGALFHCRLAPAAGPARTAVVKADSCSSARELARDVAAVLAGGRGGAAVSAAETADASIVLFDGEAAQPEAGAARVVLAATARADRLMLTARYGRDVVSSRSADGWLRALAVFLPALADAVDTPVSSLPLMDAAAARRVLEMSRGPGADAPVDVVERFLAHAQRAPDAPALTGADGALTYGDAAAAATRIANGLRAAGVVDEDRVGALVERGVLLPLALLGILMAGATYVPLSTGSPEQRLRLIVGSADLKLLLTSRPTADSAALGTPVRQIRDLAASGTDEPPAPAREGRRAAYVLFTSGTSGRPKGVVVERHALARFVDSTVDHNDIGPSDRVLAFADAGFDVSLLDMLCPLAAGARLCVASDAVREDPAELVEFLNRERVTVADVPPLLLPLLDARRVPYLRLVTAGGEPFDGRLVGPWLDSGRRFVHNYGPTEATVAVTRHECRVAEPSHPPIGTPMRGQATYVLDDQLRPVAPGMPGELWLAGDQLARGYLDADPASSAAFREGGVDGMGRMYRTGDIARWNAGGELEYLGRRDRQVKVRGVRIELAEIEAVLRTHDCVRHAVVVADTAVATGGRLAAFVVPKAAAADLERELTAFVARAVPRQAVPRIHLVAAMPATPNGKVDVDRLRAASR